MDNAWCLLTVVVQPQEAAKHHTAAFSPSPLLAHSGMWEKIGEVKFVGWNSLIGKARLCAQAKLIKTFIQSFPLAGRFPLASCFQESRVSTFMTVIWEDKCHNSECPAPSCFLMPSWGYLIQLQYNIMCYGIFLWLLWVMYPGCVPSQPLFHSQSPWWWGNVRKKTSLILCKHSSATTETPVCHQHGLGHKSNIWVAMKKMKSIWAQTSTLM